MFRRMNANGPAIKGGCVTRRKHRAESWYFSREVVTVQGGYGTCFCSPGTKLVEHYACRGTKLNASHIFIAGYKFNALQWRGPDLSRVTKLSCVQEQIAKTVTNNLPLLSVLGGRSNYFLFMQVVCLFSLFVSICKVSSFCHR
jgi:hypothetical protein